MLFINSNIIYNVVKLNTNEHGREKEKEKRKKLHKDNIHEE
jgi:hypothetical protein